MPPSAPVTTTVLPPAAAIILSGRTDEKDDTKRATVDRCTIKAVAYTPRVEFIMPRVAGRLL